MCKTHCSTEIVAVQMQAPYASFLALAASCLLKGSLSGTLSLMPDPVVYRLLLIIKQSERLATVSATDGSA